MFARILLPVDLNDEQSWQKALPLAVELATAHGAPLHVMTVVPDFGKPIVGQYFPSDYEAKVRAEAASRLEELVGRAVPPGVAADRHVASGSIYREILRVAAATAVDLIVMGSHGPELGDYLLGSNADRVVRYAPCSVLVVRA